MTKTILITGATDGIGRLTAEKLAAAGHHVLLHGRSTAKLETAAREIGGRVATYAADLSDLAQTAALAEAIRADHGTLDVVINNAGVLKAPETRTAEGLDLRFVVNTLAPYLLTRRLLPIIPQTGRIVNLSSAAQAPVEIAAMMGETRLDDMAAYAQSKLALTIWTRALAETLPGGPLVVAVNPGSLLASKMVMEGFGVAGSDLSIGADILIEASLGARFAGMSGRYFDNDAGAFAAPHRAADNPEHRKAVMQAIKTLIA
ncbi:SDR family NAD(P)-dependent oxidoreductase [Dinoroseobacter sp. S124A]|uniref:SDR family NAD(P)-dependent oxidoreductase n=1 Tax=Dinoroseobacter sp. S124A TaxID=3415128 RepID=UPI003C7D3600